MIKSSSSSAVSHELPFGVLCSRCGEDAEAQHSVGFGVACGGYFFIPEWSYKSSKCVVLL